jgi:hypothetical protein
MQNKTEFWEKNSASTKYDLPQTCPFCDKTLHATYVYVGVFPYIHGDITLRCDSKHVFNFCFPFNKLMTMGFTSFDSKDTVKPVTDQTCPFHGIKLEPIRLYGDLTFNDGTKKLQLRCPVCFYSERATLTKVVLG